MSKKPEPKIAIVEIGFPDGEKFVVDASPSWLRSLRKAVKAGSGFLFSQGWRTNDDGESHPLEILVIQVARIRSVKLRAYEGHEKAVAAAFGKIQP